jgi:hypothetical protein
MHRSLTLDISETLGLMLELTFCVATSRIPLSSQHCFQVCFLSLDIVLRLFRHHLSVSYAP